jgi:hypothetical protein
MKLEFFQQIFEKYANMKFHKNPSSGSRVVRCGLRERQTGRRTDMTKIIVAILRTSLQLNGAMPATHTLLLAMHKDNFTICYILQLSRASNIPRVLSTFISLIYHRRRIVLNTDKFVK